MKANSDIAIIIKDNFHKKAVSFMASEDYQKNEAEHMMNDLNSKAENIEDELIS